MRRFRWKRRRVAALALLPIAALTATASIALGAGELVASEAAVTSIGLKLGHHDALTGHRVALRGDVAPGGQHNVVVQVNGSRVAKVRTASDGGFKLSWRPQQPGVYKLVAIVPGHDGVAPVRSAAQRLNGYRAVQASYYGPGLYGAGMACGGTLTPSTLGVAHKTLPCGSKVTLRHGNHTVTVPVVDRGPYVSGREYDLTVATKAKLGFGSTGTVLSTK